MELSCVIDNSHIYELNSIIQNSWAEVLISLPQKLEIRYFQKELIQLKGRETHAIIYLEDIPRRRCCEEMFEKYLEGKVRKECI